MECWNNGVMGKSKDLSLHSRSGRLNFVSFRPEGEILSPLNIEGRYNRVGKHSGRDYESLAEGKR
jgi:hypothetical protein